MVRNLPMENVGVMDMMKARDRRAQKQRDFLAHHSVLVCFTLNIPGPVKVSPLIYAAFCEGKKMILSALQDSVQYDEVIEKTGLEAYFALDKEPNGIKRRMADIEDNRPLGRLFDIDVLIINGEKISREALGFPCRKCFLCGQPAVSCARSRAHTVDEMMEKINGDITAFLHAQALNTLPQAAVDALKKEALTTPKPGLVDQNNCGAHRDMTLQMFLDSADALKDYFTVCVKTGADAKDCQTIFPALQRAGLDAEKKMLCVTNGVNTHKGAIFSLGLLCAAAGYCAVRADTEAESVCRAAGDIARDAVNGHFTALDKKNARAFGEQLYIRSGIRGIRGEAADGFPSVLSVWPQFLTDVQQMALTEAGVRALLRLLTRIKDTTLIKRGGEDAATKTAKAAQRIIDHGFVSDEILALDKQMIEENLTCGGCADLLSCLYFLYSLQL